MITCPTPQCGAILRKVAGLHSAGDPPLQRDQQGDFVSCPKCHARIGWPPPPMSIRRQRTDGTDISCS
jgi:hypothetical protein